MCFASGGGAGLYLSDTPSPHCVLLRDSVSCHLDVIIDPSFVSGGMGSWNLTRTKPMYIRPLWHDHHLLCSLEVLSESGYVLLSLLILWRMTGRARTS
jgi:hypothetical protein